MLQSQIDYLKQEIDYLKEQIRELRDTVETLKPTELELPWHESPDWAQWAAMDSDNEWTWYSHEPIIRLNDQKCRVDKWLIEGGNGRFCTGFTFPPCSNWKESKRKRP